MMLITHVKIVAMLLIYLWSGEVKIEQKAFDTEVECKLAVAKRVQEIQKDPRFDGGFGAWCFEKPGDHS